MQQIKKKLLDDLSFAKENGVSTNEILKTLGNARRGNSYLIIKYTLLLLLDMVHDNMIYKSKMTRPL